VYHARHLDVYDGTDQALNLFALGGAVVVSVVLVVLSFRPTPPGPTTPPPDGGSP